MFEYVKDAGLRPARPYTERPKTDLIILHHVEGCMSVAAIHAMHIGKGNRGIDYNIYIDLDGTVWWGRGLEYEGGSVSNSYYKTKGMNARAVAIVCNGNFNKQEMPEAQKAALKRVVEDVVKYYGFSGAAQIVSHKEAAGADYTDCPGRYFPTEEVRDYIRNGGSAPVPGPPKDRGNPAIENHSATPLCNAEMQVDLVATGVKDDSGVDSVEFRLYPQELGSDALRVVEAVKNEKNPGRWAKRINIKKLFGGRKGRYVVRCRAYDSAGNYSEDYKNIKYFDIK